jgi:uncharacterized membrane protein YtjA (UPF0391 family)
MDAQKIKVIQALALRRKMAEGLQTGRWEATMLGWAWIFLVIAIIAAVFGFSGIAAGAAGIAKILFFVFLVVFVISLLIGRRTTV